MPREKQQGIRASLGGLLGGITPGRLNNWLVIAASFIIISVIILPQASEIDYPGEGDINSADIKAPFAFEYIDEEATINKKEMALKTVTPVYNLNLRLIANNDKKVERYFIKLEEVLADPAGEADKAARLSSYLPGSGITFSSGDIALLSEEKNFREFRSAILKNLHSIMSGGYTREPVASFLNKASSGMVLLKITENGIVSTREFDISAVWFHDELELKLDEALSRLSGEWLKKICRDHILYFLAETLEYNEKETLESRRNYVNSLEPIRIKVDEGDVLAAAGEEITPEIAKKLQAVAKNRLRARAIIIIGNLIIVSLAFFFLISFLNRFYGDIFGSFKNILAVSFTALLSIIIIKGIYLVSYLNEYLIPFALAAVCLTILYKANLAIFISLFISIFSGITLDYDIKFTIISLLSCLGGIYASLKVRKRSDMTQVGIFIALINIVAVIGLGFIEEKQPGVVAANALWAAGGGLLVVILASSVIPFIESLFGVLTVFKLLDLADLNSPLLKKLLIEAPGTYHHSILVGNLAEVAAEAVGANGLLARVGAYYHDIGKIIKPEYFIENQQDHFNKHDSLKPTLSASVIKSHVKDGIKLALEYKLPEAVIRFIEDHHGTSLISYFYAQALKSDLDDGVGEESFRYTGPRPRSRETAIVMLADITEASVRSLEKPNPAKIENVVRNTVTKKLEEGELSSSGLVMNDLETIIEKFIYVIMGIMHSRIEYPEGINGNEKKQ